MVEALANDGILVLGHRNPDTDASVSAHACVSFLQRTGRYQEPVTAGITGPLGPQRRPATCANGPGSLIRRSSPIFVRRFAMWRGGRRTTSRHRIGCATP